ncbi:MAG: type II toxin-antitoxin system RelB/DinJ family antitoxin, partial [Oscillibacter sp.]|nr:type II toxin-antitoxin system RelB/DinJ family antitoxin [Oscillibacter sp.]
MSTVSTTIQLDSTLQQESQTLFESLGLSLNAAITIFLRQSVREQAIPFRVGQPVFNEETRRAIEDTRRDIGV